MSGIVNLQIKEEGKTTRVAYLYTGDRFSNDISLYPKIDQFEIFNRKTIEGYFSGPVPLMKNKLTFNSSLRYSSQDGYLYGIREHDVHDKLIFHKRLVHRNGREW